MSPAAPGGMQADLLEGWIHRSKALDVCPVQASSVTGLVPFEILAGGWEREMALAGAFAPLKLSSVFRGLTPLPPGVLSPSHSLSRAVDL